MRVGGLNQDITYWAPTAADRYGQQGYAAPKLLRGRWEEKAEEATAIGGQTIISKAVAAVNQDVAVGGYLAQGDWTALLTPDLVVGAQEVRVFNRIPDLRNVDTFRKAVM